MDDDAVESSDSLRPDTHANTTRFEGIPKPLQKRYAQMRPFKARLLSGLSRLAILTKMAGLQRLPWGVLLTRA